MKKYFLILSVVAGLIACSSDGLRENVVQESTPLTQQLDPNRRSFAEAVEIAQNSIKMLDEDKALTRGNAPVRKLNLKNGVKAFCKEGTRSYSPAFGNDTLLYVFNFENDEGFALVSTSKRTQGLLAIVEQGYCDPDTPSEIDGFEQFIEMAKEYVRRNSEQKEPLPLRIPDGPIVETKDSITYSFSQVGPYITVKWGQMCPEGEFCSNGIAGCTNAAMAQIISYFNYPTSISLTYDGSNANQSLNWSDMKAHSTGHALSTCSTPSTHIMIGKLLRELGERNHSQYDATGTGTNSQLYAAQTFSNLGYTCASWSDFNGLCVRTDLNNNRLILIRGTATAGGHAWALDGYKTRVTTIRQMARTATSGWFFTGEVTTLTDHFMHFNWGWYGNCNGYFAEGVYDTSQALLYDTEIHNENYNFNINVAYLSVYH